MSRRRKKIIWHLVCSQARRFNEKYSFQFTINSQQFQLMLVFTHTTIKFVVVIQINFIYSKAAQVQWFPSILPLIWKRIRIVQLCTLCVLYAVLSLYHFNSFSLHLCVMCWRFCGIYFFMLTLLGCHFYMAYPHNCSSKAVIYCLLDHKLNSIQLHGIERKKRKTSRWREKNFSKRNISLCLSASLSLWTTEFLHFSSASKQVVNLTISAIFEL